MQSVQQLTWHNLLIKIKLIIPKHHGVMDKSVAESFWLVDSFWCLGIPGSNPASDLDRDLIIN